MDNKNGMETNKITAENINDAAEQSGLSISGFAKDGEANVAFLSSGCKLNQFETFQFQEIFRLSNPGLSLNFVEPDLTSRGADKDVNVFFLNTCAVTEKANIETNRIIRKIRRKYPESLLVLTGCSVQLESGAFEDLPNIKLIDNEKKARFMEIASSPSMSLFLNQKRTRPYLKIQEGCNIKCSFCVIPFARPKVWSMEPEEVITALKGFNDRGFREAILTGVNIGSYGQDFQENGNYLPEKNRWFKKLLKMAARLDIPLKIRISSIDPVHFDDELIDILSGAGNIQNHFHIPLQSGSDRILKLMNRRYLFADYSRIIEKLHSKVKDAGIGTDIISGFPTETREDFEETVKNLSGLPLQYIHAFSYSDRKGTPSSLIFPKTNEKVIRERTAKIREISSKKRKGFTEKFLNKPLEFLSLPSMTALSSNYIRAEIGGDGPLIPPGKAFMGAVISAGEKNVVKFTAYI